MAFLEDFTEFLSTDDFAVDAEIAGDTVTGIFEESFIESLGVETLTPIFNCVLADVSSVNYGDAVTVNNTTYHVTGIQKDGTGMVALILGGPG